MISATFILSSASAFNLDLSKISLFGKELIKFLTYFPRTQNCRSLNLYHTISPFNNPEKEDV